MPDQTEPTTDPVEAVARAMHDANHQPAWHERASGIRSTYRRLARTAIDRLAGLGAVMPDDAEKLRADLKRATAKQRWAEQHARRAEADAAESHAEAKQLEARLATFEAVHARHRAYVYEERDEMLAKVDDVLALCRPTHADTLAGVSAGDRLRQIEALLTREADRGGERREISAAGDGNA